MKPDPIATARLHLRALAAGDLALFRDLYSDAETMRHIGRPLSPEQAKASLHATLDATRKPHGPRFFVIVERRRRHAVGLCSIRRASARERSVEVGIMLARAARGRGYAAETISALIAAGFQTLPIDTVWVQYRPANAAMARLCESLGFSAADDWRPRGARPRQCVGLLRRSAACENSHQPPRGVAMSNIIGFLENAGRDAALRHASREQLLHAMQREEIEPALCAALLQPERMAIDGLLGVREKMYCSNKAITPPKPKEAPAKKTPAKAPPKKTPAKKAPTKR